MTTFRAGRAVLRWRAERRWQRIERAVRGVGEITYCYHVPRLVSSRHVRSTKGANLMRMLDIYESVGAKYDLIDSIPHFTGPWVHRDGMWIPSIDVSVCHEAATGTAILNESVAFRHENGDISFAPYGLRFDGGSKPGFSWPFFGHPWNEYLFAYAIHDSDWDQIWKAYYHQEITAGMRRRYLRVADRNFKRIQRAIKRDWLNKKGNKIEQFKIRVKHLAVRAFSHVRAIGGNPNA